MSSGVTVQVLDVGQGSGNLIEVYDGGVLSNLVLVDLGSELAWTEAGLAAAAYVVSQILELGKKKTNPNQPKYTLDAVILTHSDSDHINLIGKLLETFTSGTGPNQLRIKNIWYGGDRDLYVKRSINYLAKAEEYLLTGEKAQPFGAPQVDFDPSPPLPHWKAFLTAGEATFSAIVANSIVGSITLVDESTRKLRKLSDGYIINMKSLVLLVGFRGCHWIITGDATGLTLAHCNQVLAQAGDVSNCFMLTAPHHASETTTFDVGGLDSATFDKYELPYENAEAFARKTGALCLSASAEQQPRFKHPAYTVLRALGGTIGTGIFTKTGLLNDAHFFNAFFRKHAVTIGLPGTTVAWPESDGWYTAQTKVNLFTTLYLVASQQQSVLMPPAPGTPATPWIGAPSIKPPPRGVQWAFASLADGTKLVGYRSNREVLAAATAAGHILPRWRSLFGGSLDRRPVAPIAGPDALHEACIPIESRLVASAPRASERLLGRLRRVL